MELDDVALGAVWGVIGPILDERQRRVVAGGIARACGRGGVAGVARATGLSRSTVSTGAREIDSGEIPVGRVRAPGQGRPSSRSKGSGGMEGLRGHR